MKKNTDNSSNVRRIARELPTNITPLKFIVEIKNTSGKGVSN